MVEDRSHAKTRDEAAARQASEDFKWLMSERAGRRIVWRMLVSAGIYRSTYSGNPTDTAFNEGRRAFGLEIISAAMANSDLFVAMMKENEDVR